MLVLSSMCIIDPPGIENNNIKKKKKILSCINHLIKLNAVHVVILVAIAS